MSYSLPRARVRVQSQQVVAPAAPGSYAAAGVAAAGPLSPVLVSTIDALVSTFKFGPLVKENAYQLAKTGVPVLVRRILPTTQAASIGAPDLSAWTGDNPPSFTGTPNNYYKVIVEVTTPGAVGVAAGRYSLDGGDTYTTPAVFTDPQALGTSGISIDFGAGDLEGIVTVQAYPASQARIGPTITRAGSSTAVPSLAGTPLDRYEGRFEVLAGGTLGTATPAIRYRLSLDGGRTWQQEASLGTALSITVRDGKEGLSSEEDSGLTLTLGTSSQTLDLGDVITFETTAPAIAASDVLTALDDLKASSYGWEFAHIVGAVAGAAAATIGARFQTWAAAAVGGARFTWGVWSTRQQYTGESDTDYDASVNDADYVALVNTRVSSWGGDGPRITCPITQRRNQRPVACVLVPELWSRPIEEDPMRVGTGPLTSDIALYESGVRIAHDARADVALHAARFGTLRTYEETPGVYVTRGSTFDVVNGEESRIPRRRVLDLASTTFQRVLVLQLGDGVDRNADGTIDELEAQRLEEATVAELGPVLGGRSSDFRVVVDRTTPLTPSTPLSELVKVLGLEYLDELNGTIGFVATLPEEG